MIRDRAIRVQKQLAENGLGGLLVSSPVNCFYLTGFAKPNGDFRALQLLVTPQRTYLLTNPLYEGSVRQWLTSNSPKVGLAPSHRGLLENVATICRKEKIKTLGFEGEDLKLFEYLKLQKKLQGVELVLADSILGDRRQAKSEAEISLIKKAAAITDSTFSQILPIIRPGLSEKELAVEIDYRLNRNGADEAAYETIVAAGPHSAIPHHKTGNRKIGRRDILLLDFGARYHGYCADMTRVVFLGQPTTIQKKIYHFVLATQEVSLAKIKLGLRAAAAAQIAEDFFRRHRLEKHFLHSLGHGLGLQIHEPPRLASGSPDRLNVGHVFSVEPGLYFPGRFGVRIEDIVVLRKNGPENLTKTPKTITSL